MWLVRDKPIHNSTKNLIEWINFLLQSWRILRVYSHKPSPSSTSQNYNRRHKTTKIEVYQDNEDVLRLISILQVRSFNKVPEQKQSTTKWGILAKTPMNKKIWEGIGNTNTCNYELHIQITTNMWCQTCKPKLFIIEVDTVKYIPDNQGKNLAALLLNKPVLLWQQPAANSWNQENIIAYHLEYDVDINHKRFS